MSQAASRRLTADLYCCFCASVPLALRTRPPDRASVRRASPEGESGGRVRRASPEGESGGRVRRASPEDAPSQSQQNATISFIKIL